MKLKTPSLATTTISFKGDDVHKVLAAHKDVVAEIWVVCSGMVDTTVVVHTNPRLTDTEPMVWSMNVSSPLGRRSIAVTQRRTAGNVIFTNE